MFQNRLSVARRDRRTIRLAAALMLGTSITLFSAAPVQAQQNDSALRGRITEGGQVTATQVVAVEVETGYRRTSPVSQTDGSYNFASLRPGRYRLEIVGPNGTRPTQEFTLSVGQNAELNFDLPAPGQPAPTAPATGGEPTTGANDTTGTETTGNEDVQDITGNEPIVVTASQVQSLEGGEVGAVISQRLIEQLPQNNRNFLAFADLAPGVQFITDASGNSRVQGGAQRANAVNIYIDGVGQKDYVLKNGITGQDSTQGNPFPQLAIGEYRVISSNYKAEFDQVSSAAITAVTKSGTNEFHGESFIDFTNQSLRAKSPSEKFTDNGDGTFGTEKVKTRDFQFGGALGGPIIKDVMHFFVTYEGKRQQVPVDIFPGLSRTVDSFPEEYRDAFGTTNRTFNEDLYFGKIDIVPTEADLLEFSVKYRDESGENLNNGSNAASTRSFINTKEWRGLGRWQHTADDWINEFNLAYEDVKWGPRPGLLEPGFQFSYAGPDEANTPGVVQRGDLLRIGGGGNYQTKGQRGWTVSDDFTYTGFDRHTFKAGVKVKWIKLSSLELNNFNPLYTFNTGYNPDGGVFNDQIPYRLVFSAPLGDSDPQIRSNNFQLGLYIQDDWEVTDRLTLNLGIRWDYERTPSYLDFVTPQDAVDALSPENYPNLVNANFDIRDYISDGSNRHPFKGAFQPRLGFSYELDNSGRFVLFGGYGRSYDRNQFDFLQQEISTGAYPSRTFNFITGDPFNTCDASPTCVPFDPIYLTEEGRQQLLAGTGTAGGRELHLINNDLKVPYSDQFSLGVRGRFQALEAEVGYSHVESHDGFVFLLGNRQADGSFFTFDAVTGAPQSPFGSPPPGFGSLLIGTNGIETSADSAYLKLTKNYSASSPWSLNATYTYTEAEENRAFGETFSFDFPTLDDYGMFRSSGVRKHRFVAAGSVDIPWGFSLSTKVTMASPPYLTALRNLGGDNPSRDVVVSRAFGNGDRWGLRQIDFALTKYIPIFFISDEARLRFRIDILNAFNDRNYVDYNNNPTDDIRTSPTDTIYRERQGYAIGGNPPRTIKVSAGFSF